MCYYRQICYTQDSNLRVDSLKQPQRYLEKFQNLAVCCGAISRRREKLQYRCTTTITHVQNSPEDIWKNLLLV